MRPLMYRVLCHFILDQLPDPALPEVCESLRDFHEYYSLPAVQQPALPATRQVVAHIGSRYERPGFSIDEE